MNTQEFIRKAREVHGRKYSYTNTFYARPYNKVCITCRIHGEYNTFPTSHLRGASCPYCHHHKIFVQIFDYYYNK